MHEPDLLKLSKVSALPQGFQLDALLSFYACDHDVFDNIGIPNTRRNTGLCSLSTAKSLKTMFFTLYQTFMKRVLRRALVTRVTSSESSVKSVTLLLAC